MKLILKKVLLNVSLITCIIILSYILYKESKTESIEELQQIAYNELHYYDHIDFLKEHNFQGPNIRRLTKETVTFQWYSILEWGDSASIYVKVYKSFIKRLTQNQTTMNYQWGYLSGPTYILKDFIPKFYKSDEHIYDNIDTNSIVIPKNVRLLKPKELIIKLLKEGYVDLIDVRDTVTFVKFIESIAICKYKKGYDGKQQRINDVQIKIFKNRSITIQPFDSPVDFWDKYDYHWDPIGLSKGKYDKQKNP